MKRLLKQRLAELDELEAVWQDVDDLPETVAFLVRDTAEQCANAGLPFHETMPENPTIISARCWLVASLNALKANPSTDWTVTQVARRLQVSRDKILGWINTGKLHAADTANGRLPRYRVKASDVDAFLSRRTKTVKMPVQRRRRLPVAETRYYPEA
jgi:excisionase family DNA binding protein